MSRKRRNLPLAQPPLEIIRGAQITAEYLNQEVPALRDNPLCEALPPILTPQEVTEYLLQLPPYSDLDREMSQVSRLQMTETAREFFVPNGKHLTVYYGIMNMIRRGYVRRNPVLWGYWKQVHNNIESFLKAIKEKPFPNSRARGMSLVGTGGTGKSTTVEKIIQSLPQVITHVSYKDQVFIMKQLVWLKLDCPRKGSLSELCVNFFRAVDEILETQYEKRYAVSYRRTLEDMIGGIARVAANHCLGVIVIDELQDLSEARSGGDITMVNFFVHLENAIGIPFALIGTQDALPILMGQFRQARRVSEQGYIFWDRMSEVEPEFEEFDDSDEEVMVQADKPLESLGENRKDNNNKKNLQPDLVWKNFIETLWTYQYVKKPRSLGHNIVEDKCAHMLYRISKGIPAVVQTIFVLTQQLAILTGGEEITPGLIKDTVRQNQEVIKEMLGEAQMKKPKKIKPVGDLIDLDEIYEAEPASNHSSAWTDASEIINESKVQADTVNDKNVRVQHEQGGEIANSMITSNKMASRNKSKKLNKNSRQKDADLSKTGFRPGPPRKDVQSKSRGKKTKYGKSPDEYL